MNREGRLCLNGIDLFSRIHMLSKILLTFIFFGVLTPSCFAQTGVSSGLIVFPVVSPKISSFFGTRMHPVLGHQLHHGGIDLAAPEKSHVRSVLDGRVVFAGLYAGYGKLVTIEHTSGRTTLYGHLSEISVNVGKTVSAGDVIGRVGSTGISTGPHLHFEWRENGQVVNPLEVFPNLRVTPKG